ncbi:type II toxin-antitoxin system MqsA family antitoxin [Methanoplanus endosymbiosus]|uniref:Type II toxin-antitoxin system MqsA family antitoxin n=1 Tax=Methanoplanus endosymbiosus TaxID=33865 RepID=A0A9E7PMT2_9EURY|nr:type II toxin-antitoxin system MqsA family antitoxin [Methanoplanus endosymbiosus]UUX93124.1 type II toxin-antitoxin system MqsA family antitoxin [Methanoplanus endosymbiosus]
MIPDRCSYCKGKLNTKKTEFIAESGEKIIVIREIPAYICNQCKEAYFTPEISRKIDEIMKRLPQ